MGSYDGELTDDQIAWLHECAAKRREHWVGKYRADYSELTPEELGAPDPEYDNLLANSRPK